MKRLALASVVALAAWGVSLIPAPAAAADPCAGVRCMECPPGTYWAPKPNDCCRCLPNP